MIPDLVPDLSSDPAARRAVKRPIPVQVEFAAVAGSVHTLEGTVPHAAGDAILTGVQGERWPVARARFLATYDPVPPTAPGSDGAYVKRRIVVLARQLDAPASVPAGVGGTLHGKPGDWLLQHPDGSWGIVAPEIFAATYEPD